jgi:hypothetical protein
VDGTDRHDRPFPHRRAQRDQPSPMTRKARLMINHSAADRRYSCGRTQAIACGRERIEAAVQIVL